MVNASVNEKSIGLLADPKGLAVSIVEKILLSGFGVKIFTDKKSDWTKACHNYINNKSLELLNVGEYPNSNIKYLIYISGFVERGTRQNINVLSKRDLGIVNEINKQLARDQKRVLAIYPYITDSKTKVITRKSINSFVNNEGLGIYLVGDLLGPRMNLASSDFLPNVFKDVISGGETKVPRSEMKIYPTSIPETVEVIVRSLYSFGPYSNERMLLTGSVVSVSDILESIYKADSNVVFSYDDKSWDRKKLRINERFVINFDNEKTVSETLSWFKKQGLEKEDEGSVASVKPILTNNIIEKSAAVGSIVYETKHVSATKQKPGKQIEPKAPKTNVKVLYKQIAFFLIFLMVIIMSPIITLLMSGSMFALGAKSLEIGQYEISEGLFKGSASA